MGQEILKVSRLCHPAIFHDHNMVSGGQVLDTMGYQETHLKMENYTVLVKKKNDFFQMKILAENNFS